MTLQWATRAGVLRHLRLGNALVRPTRVISVQNQLRRVCLAAKPRSATPQTCSVSFLISQQSRSLATATERPKAKRSSKASSGNGKTSSSAKPTKKKKKVLTEKQKEAKALRERRAQIKELKQTALVAPKKLAQSAWQLAIAAKFADIRSQYSSSQEAFKEATTVVKSLGADEYEVCPPLRRAVSIEKVMLIDYTRLSKPKLKRTGPPTRRPMSHGSSRILLLRSNRPTLPGATWLAFKTKEFLSSKMSGWSSGPLLPTSGS